MLQHGAAHFFGRIPIMGSAAETVTVAVDSAIPVRVLKMEMPGASDVCLPTGPPESRRDMTAISKRIAPRALVSLAVVRSIHATHLSEGAGHQSPQPLNIHHFHKIMRT